VAAYLALLNYCPTFTEQAPQWAIAFAGLALFIYSTLDNADGKQARKTGSGSPLGLLFDHGMDAINTGMVGTLTFVMATGLAGGSEAGNLRLPFALWCFTSLAFFLNTWEEFHIREFILPIVNGPSEGLVVTVGLFLLTAFKGE
jgi:ethanolaminephosphotransferase